MKEVYVFQVGTLDCYKVGFTRAGGDQRKKNVSTGSPEKLTKIRSIETEEHSVLENYVHNTLDHKRAPNGEFFNCKIDEIDEAINNGLKYIENDLPKIKESDSYKDKEPNDVIVPASSEIVNVYEELRKAKQQEFFIKQKINSLESAIKCSIGQNLGVEGIASWKWILSDKLDTSGLKEKYPDIVSEFTQKSGARRFSLERR